MPNTQSEPFVKRFEMAIMQYVILSKAQQGEVTRENLKQTFRGNLQMSSDHFDHCIRELVQDGHLKEVGGNKFTTTDDGREDVQKLTNLVIELPSVVQQGGGQPQKQGMAQQKAAGGSSTGGASGSGSTTGSTTGNQGNFGSSQRSGSDAGATQGGTHGQGSVNKGGSSSTPGDQGGQNKQR